MNFPGRAAVSRANLLVMAPANRGSRLYVNREVGMSTRFGFVSALTLALLLAAPAFAQHPRQAMPDRNLSKHDMSFVKDAAIGGLAEVELGKLAQQNGQDNQVKQFGARMEQDHGKANDELSKIATGKGMTLPQQLDAKHA